MPSARAAPTRPGDAAARRRLVVLVAVFVLVAGVAGGLAVWSGRTTGHSADGEALDPASFEPGACRVYPPTHGDRHLTVFLDAGHGGLDPGSVGTTASGRSVTEASLTLPVELDTMALLRAQG